MDQFDRNPTTPGRWFSVRILNGSASEGRPVGREGALELVRPEMAIWSDTSVGGGAGRSYIDVFWLLLFI